jgi:hypothetical protein
MPPRFSARGSKTETALRDTGSADSVSVSNAGRAPPVETLVSPVAGVGIALGSSAGVTLTLSVSVRFGPGATAVSARVLVSSSV